MTTETKTRKRFRLRMTTCGAVDEMEDDDDAVERAKVEVQIGLHKRETRRVLQPRLNALHVRLHLHAHAQTQA
jgi:hypothetical protein